MQKLQLLVLGLILSTLGCLLIEPEESSQTKSDSEEYETVDDQIISIEPIEVAEAERNLELVEIKRQAFVKLPGNIQKDFLRRAYFQEKKRLQDLSQEFASRYVQEKSGSLVRILSGNKINARAFDRARKLNNRNQLMIAERVLAKSMLSKVLANARLDQNIDQFVANALATLKSGVIDSDDYISYGYYIETRIDANNISSYNQSRVNR